MKFPSIKYSILIVLSISVYLFQIWFAGAIGGFEMLIMTAFLSVVVASVLSLVRMIFGRKTPLSRENIAKVFLIISSLHAFLHILLFGFFFYQNSVSPAYLGRVTLSNGQKELVFQNMSHIATRSFYERVGSDIAISTASGYSVFYEGVGSGSVESEEKLDDLLGLKFEPDTYGIIASIIGMEDQDYREIFRSVKDRTLVTNVDLPLDTLIKLYNTKSGSTTKPDIPPVDMGSVLSGVTLRPQERLVIGFIGRGFLNFLLKQDTSFLLSGESGLMDKNLLDIILHERNEHIASVIQSSEKQKIYALYGALHFDGVFAELKLLDSNWKILSVESIRPY